MTVKRVHVFARQDDGSLHIQRSAAPMVFSDYIGEFYRRGETLSKRWEVRSVYGERVTSIYRCNSRREARAVRRDFREISRCIAGQGFASSTYKIVCVTVRRVPK